MDVWTTVHAERAALIDDLDGLEPARWEVPSLCTEWTVHDVLAHLLDTACTTRLGFVASFARCGFDFDRHTARGVVAQRRADPAATLARFREVAMLRSTPPAPLDSRLTEAIVHGEDIRRPLGLRGTYPADAVAASLRLQTRTSTTYGGGRELLDGLRLRASDADLVVGDGREITGPALSLLLAVCGRDVALADLDGPGLEVLRSR